MKPAVDRIDDPPQDGGRNVQRRGRIGLGMVLAFDGLVRLGRFTRLLLLGFFRQVLITTKPGPIAAPA